MDDQEALYVQGRIRRNAEVAKGGKPDQGESVYRQLDDAVAIFSSGSANIQVTLWQFRPTDRGKYRFRISAYAFQSRQAGHLSR